jgi:hypothetical protein
MAWTAPMTAVSGSVFTAAQFNQHVRDNLNETAAAKATTAGTYFVGNGVNTLVERSLTSDIVETSETTTSTSYTDLTTVGPTVTVTTGAEALIIVTADITNNTAGQSGRMTFEVSGSSTITANDIRALRVTVPAAASGNMRASVVTHLDLTGGTNTFTAKYRASGGTASFANRRITVMPF